MFKNILHAPSPAKSILCSITFLFLNISPITSHAQSSYDDSANQEALEKTKQLLTNPEQRNQAIKGDANAQKADAYTKSVGGKHSDEIYSLASKVFEKLVKKYNGDTAKIQQVLDQAAKNPASFAESEFTAEERRALSELAAKLPQSAPTNK